MGTSTFASSRAAMRALAAACAFALAAIPARASNYIGGSGGNWSLATNWSGAAVPSGAAATGIISLTPSGAFNVNFDFIYTALTGISQVTLNSGNSFDLTLNQTLAASTMISNTEIIGDTGRGIYNQSNGLNSIGANLTLANTASGIGSYNLSGAAQLSVTGNELIGALGTGVGPTAGGTFTQNGGSNSIVGSLVLANNPSSTGLYTMSAGSFTATTLTSGNSGNGAFSSTGGTINLGNAATHNGTLLVGQNATSTSTFTLDSTASLNVSGAEYVGVSGNGTFTQIAGTHTLNGNPGSVTLLLGVNAGSTGTYNQSGGSFTNASGIEEYVGYFGTGIFNQSGGTHTINNNWFTIGWGGTGQGTYNLSNNATLIVHAIEWIGYQGNGIFTQTGGTHTIGTAAANSILFIGDQPGSSGSYTLSGATSQLNVFGNEFIGNFGGAPGGIGSFTQSGGAHTATGYIQVGAGQGAAGSYALSGGTLSATSLYIGFNGTGAFSQTGGAATFGSNGTFNGSLTLGANPSSTNSTFFLDAPGSLTVNGSEQIGSGGTATFTQAGGTHTIAANASTGNLTLGNATGSSGTYIQSGGTFIDSNSNAAITSQEYIGLNGAGVFTQTGGIHTIGTAAVPTGLQIGYQSGSAGSYSLSGASSQLTVNGSETLSGAGGAASFIQNGGTHTITNNLTLAGVSGVSASFDLNGGTLNAGNVLIGNGGTGTFKHIAGNFNATTLTMANVPGSPGTYTLSGGTLAVAGNERDALDIPGASGISGQFTQSGGTHSVGGLHTIGSLPGSVGSYTLSGFSSTLSVAHGQYVGDAGTGTFDQLTGTSTIAGTNGDGLFVGFAAGGLGTYNLKGGTLNVTASYGEVIGFNGQGTFNQTGGAQTISNQFLIGSNGLGSGTFNLKGGSITVPSANVLRQGTFNFSDGYLTGPGGVPAFFENDGAFTYSGGTFNARLINRGNANILNFFAPADGIENDATLFLNQTTVLQGFGLDNIGTLFLDNGFLIGSAPAVNDYGALMYARGTINSTFINRGTLNVTGLLTATGPNTNQGVINLGPANTFRGPLTNTASVNLSGGVITGAVTNNSGGRIQGGGSLSGAVSNNSGGLISAASTASPLVLANLLSNAAGAQLAVQENATLLVNNSFTNLGLITLEGPHSLFGGSAFTNSGTVAGQGQVSQPITNNGIIRAEAGQLTLAGGGSNSSTGQIQAPTGATVFYSAGLASNAGTIALSGGAFDNNNLPISNPGTISGNGVIRTGGLTNTGSINVADLPTSFFGAITNNNLLKVTSNTTTFFGPVTNNVGGTIKTTTAVARFLATFTNNGAYISDPADNFFEELNIGPSGYLVGGIGDRFLVSGNLNIASTRSADWDTAMAELHLIGSRSHRLSVPGTDRGAVFEGYDDNFAYGSLTLGVGQNLDLVDADSTAGGAVYVGHLDLPGGLDQISSITGNGLSIYYDLRNPANSYLGANSYELSGGGSIVPVPEPISGMLAVAITPLLALGRRRRR